MKMRKKGITLIELMIAMALSAIVAGTIVFIVATAKRLMVGGVAYMDATQQNQQIINRAKQEIELANLIYGAEATRLSFYRNSFSLAPLASSFYTPVNKVTSDNPEDLPWQASDPVNGPFWKGIQDDVVVYFFSRTPQGLGAVYREVRDGYNPSTRLQGPTMISDPNIEVDHLKFEYFNYTMQFPEYLPYRYTGGTVWNQGGAVYTQYAKIPPYTRDVKVVITPGNYPINVWKTLSGTRELDLNEGCLGMAGCQLTVQSRTATPAAVWWEDDLPAGASWNSYADVFNVCTVGSCNGVDAVVNGPDGRQNQPDATRPGLVWRTMPYDEPWAYSGLKFMNPDADGLVKMARSHSEEYVPDYPNPYQKIHMHYFTNGAALPSAGNFGSADETHVFVHAYINPSPIDYTKEIMLMFHCNDGAHCTGGPTGLGYWKHRAYWCAKDLLKFDNQNDKDENGNGSSIDDGLIPWGINGVSRAYLGELPPAGQWVVMSVPVTKAGVDLKNRQITGMAFALYGGQVYWDKASYGTWTAWMDTPGGTAAESFTSVISSTNNYYQWRAYMERPENDETVTPVLKDVTLKYGSDLSFTSAAYPVSTIYSTSQDWLSTTDAQFNRSKDKKSTAVNPDGTITLARPKCFEFQATNRLGNNLASYPIVVSANTFNEVIENDMRGDGNDVRVYRKDEFDKKCISYPNTTANLPAPAGCTGSEAAFKISGRGFGTSQTNVAFLDTLPLDNVGTPAVNEGQKSYYMCYGDLTDNTGYWVYDCNHKNDPAACAGQADLGGAAINAVNEPYLGPGPFPKTSDGIACGAGIIGCITSAVARIVNGFPLNIGEILGGLADLWTCLSNFFNCIFNGSIPKFHVTNPMQYSHNYRGSPPGFPNTYYSPTGAPPQFIFTSYGGLTAYNDYHYCEPSFGVNCASDNDMTNNFIAGIYALYDMPEMTDAFAILPNVSGHIFAHSTYDVAENKYYYIATPGQLGGCGGFPGARMDIQYGTTPAEYCRFSQLSGVVTQACGALGSVTATLLNTGAPGGTPLWWEVKADKPIMGLRLYQVQAANAGLGLNKCVDLPRDDDLNQNKLDDDTEPAINPACVVPICDPNQPASNEEEDFFRTFIYHPGDYVRKDSYQQRTNAVDYVQATFPASGAGLAGGGNVWAYTLGSEDDPTAPDYYKMYVDDDTDGSATDDLPAQVTGWSSVKGGKHKREGGFGCGGTTSQNQGAGANGSYNAGGVGAWCILSLSITCGFMPGTECGAGWVWIDLGPGGKTFDRIEMEWASQEGPSKDQEIWAMPDTVAASTCYAAPPDTDSRSDGLMSNCGEPGATRLAANGFVRGGGFEEGFNDRGPLIFPLAPVPGGGNWKYDYASFNTQQTGFRYIGIYGGGHDINLNEVRIWNNTSSTGYDLKSIGGSSGWEWYDTLCLWPLGCIRDATTKNNGYAYFLNKPAQETKTYSVAVRQLHKIEVGCYDNLLTTTCSNIIDDGIVLAAGGAFYQPPRVTPAKPLGWLNPAPAPEGLSFTKYASDTAVGSSPANAIDNDLGSEWQSGNNITAATQPRLYMDMGQDRKINMIVVYPSYKAGTGYRYSVNVAKSADCPLGCDNCPASAWVQVGMKADMQASSEGGDIFSFAPRSYRCVMEEFLDGSQGDTGAGSWWSSGVAGDLPAKILEQEAYFAKFERTGFYHSMPFVGDSHRTWTIPYTKDAYDIRLHFVMFDPHSNEDYVTVWDTVTSNVLWTQAPGAAGINAATCTVGTGNAALPGDPATQFWTPWLRSCLTSAGAYNPALCQCYDEALTNTGASTKIPGQQVKLFWQGPLGYDGTKKGWVIDKYQIWGIINPALIQVEVMSCSGKGKSRRCVSTVDKVQPANLLYNTRLRNVMK